MALKEKAKSEELYLVDIGVSISSLVAKTENLSEIVQKAKDEIISTVVNLQLGAQGVGAGDVSTDGGNMKGKNLLTDMKDEIITTMVNLQIGTRSDGDRGGVNSYAKTLKSIKYLLVAKSSDKACSVVNRKDELAGVLKDIPVVNTRFTSGGNIIMNFASEAERENAARRIDSGMENIEMTFTKKMWPKIMICNVSKEENKDDILDYLVAKTTTCKI